MEAQEISSIIDKIAEKLGVAASEVALIAERVIQEYQIKSIVGAACWVVMAVGIWVIGGVLIRRCGKAAELSESEEDKTGFRIGEQVWWVVRSIISIGFLICASGHIREACAPTYYCLKALLG